MNEAIVEWAPFKTKPGIDEATLLKLSEAIQEDFLVRQKGYQHRELVKGKADGEYVDIIWWASQEDAEAASKLVYESETCSAYFAAMDYDPSDPSAQPLHFKVMRDWAG